MLKGIRWRVGSGEKTRVFADPWLPKPTSFKILLVPVTSILLVKDLLLALRIWNDTMIKNNLLPIDGDLIRSIPLSLVEREDDLIWHYDPSGAYTVKYGYKILLNEQINSSVCSSSSLFRWWKALWKLNILLKLHIFLSESFIIHCHLLIIWPRDESKMIFGARTAYIQLNLLPMLFSFATSVNAFGKNLVCGPLLNH
ncbi:hypothetical protein TorRG33x02_326520 [Trema orientale]|uniref:Uncharacterized protein n=1 Tax=Trema orientale TaxID=63057 RepID=A0A2P5BBZ2_TREOI|nr:hypothetical protein TorRG33x02_326520 [Trema orientale]